MHPQCNLTVFCFQGIEKGCIGNKMGQNTKAFDQQKLKFMERNAHFSINVFRYHLVLFENNSEIYHKNNKYDRRSIDHFDVLLKS